MVALKSTNRTGTSACPGDGGLLGNRLQWAGYLADTGANPKLARQLFEESMKRWQIEEDRQGIADVK